MAQFCHIPFCQGKESGLSMKSLTKNFTNKILTTKFKERKIYCRLSKALPFIITLSDAVVKTMCSC